MGDNWTAKFRGRGEKSSRLVIFGVYSIGVWQLDTILIKTHSVSIYLPNSGRCGLSLFLWCTMKSRICTGECGQEKELTPEFFHRCKSSKTGFMEQCKVCRNTTARKYHHDNKEHVQEYRKNNRDKINKATREWRQNNKDKYNELRKRRYHNVDKNRPEYKIKQNLRKRMAAALNGECKSASTLALLGCSPDELRQHLEAQWTEGMSWDNYGVYIKGEPMKWHIDHIIPCDSFDLTNETEQAECFHYSNLQPMWGIDNIRKSNACSK